MPDAITCEGVAVRYRFAQANAVGPVTLRVARGERVLLLGPSGCGKSTLLHSLTGLIPRSIPAERSGEIALFGTPVDTRPPADWAARVAFLFQDADQTLAGFTVADEIAFSLENRAVPPECIAAGVDRALADVNLPAEWRERRIATLSGGQKQLVALAAVLAQGADILIADEPTASLAPAAAARLAAQVLAPGATALVVDHRLGELLPLIDRVVVLGRDGQPLAQGTPAQVFGDAAPRLLAQGIWVPLAARIRIALNEAGYDLPAFWRMEDLVAHLPPKADIAPLILPRARPPGPAVVRLTNADCAPPFGPVILRDITLTLRAGEVLGVIGPNGAGKSTLGLTLAGLSAPRAGHRTGPAGAIAFQSSEAHFSTDSARAELAAAGVPANRLEAALADWGLSNVAGEHPFTLSNGQKRRLALALLTTTDRWPLVVLDEPTAGLDHAGSQTIARQIGRLAREGRALAVITHDADFALSVCDRVAILDQGRVMAEGPASGLLSDSALLAKAGLAPPEAAPLLARLAQTSC